MRLDSALVMIDYGERSWARTASPAPRCFDRGVLETDSGTGPSAITDFTFAICSTTSTGKTTSAIIQRPATQISAFYSHRLEGFSITMFPVRNFPVLPTIVGQSSDHETA